MIKILEKRASGCLVFLDQLQHELSSIPVELEQDSEFTSEEIREWAIQEVCLQQAMADEPSDEVFSAYPPVASNGTESNVKHRVALSFSGSLSTKTAYLAFLVHEITPGCPVFTRG